MNNNADYVTAGKPKKGGAIFRAPLGTTLPTNALDDLDEAFVNVGYISEDGVTNSNSPESDDIKAWGGDTVLALQTAKPDTFKFGMIESINKETLSTVYGPENVSGDLTEGITVVANSNDMKEYAYVIEMSLKNNVVKRVVIPDAKITNIDDITYQDGGAVAYNITLTAIPDIENNTHYEYLIQGMVSA